jgi:lipoprotein-anchoring transpeptidase ErfK/SrfK
VRLDRQGFSSGPIDGKAGANFLRTISAYQTARNLPLGKPDCATWEALAAASPEPVITTYMITEADMKGPFEKVPPKLADQAKLKALGYQSPMELIAERFHAAPALIAQLNRGVNIAAGREIQVPAVAPFDPDTKPAADAAAADITIHVSKEESALRAKRGDGTLAFYAPVSSGSVHDPLPPGDFKVLGVGWRPVFNYNPDLFWDAKPSDAKAKIPAGPNNPVGVVWIALNLEHYGLHGTPEPGNIGHTESHGCVRLTNWDAARVASLVQPGTPVQFRE